MSAADQRIGLTPAGTQAVATGKGPGDIALFEVKMLGDCGLVAFVDGAGAEELLRGVKRGERVEIRRVGEASGAPGSLTAAGVVSGWKPAAEVCGVTLSDAHLDALDMVHVALKSNSMSFGEFMRRAKMAMAAANKPAGAR